MRARIIILAVVGWLAAGCSSSPLDVTAIGTDDSTTVAVATTSAPTTLAPTTVATSTTAAPTTIPPTTAPATSAPSTTNVATTGTSTPPTATLVITEFGIGPALLGMTADETQSALGSEFSVVAQDDIRVDFSGFNILYDGDIVFSAAISFDGDFVDAFITDHPGVAFANGIAPSSGLAGMVAAFGPGNLSFSYDNEGREFFNFDDDSVVPRNASIETQLGDGGHAGLYTTDDTFNQTAEFDPNGVVKAIWVTCTPPEGFNPCPQ